ncbi:V-type ATP synthase subunit D [Marichromatium bheemlicum]|uniref:V-type ATP synthase subunit D n=1 Tax=Marichromatium bheemlicum TaxID=365339 RepID=A0ABX1I6N5_9GAMM|nr:V-type ATP synthase subunit D [Marichromatium bheemlicum]NKN33223.1 V-type ATP synthase subunit D [Marichromatium bheemlicum]
MARLSLSKSSLAKQQRQLQTFERYLPSLDLKRRQLLVERARAQDERTALEQAIAALRAQVREQLPMLANTEIPLAELTHVAQVQIDEENRMGTRLPRLVGVDFTRTDYGCLSRPHWVDPLVERLEQMLELRLRLHLQQRRVALLETAVRKVTQRVNLFEKVLIPRTRAHIKRIRVALSDAERAAVVRSKIAKAKRQRGGLA